ncbi:LysR family transcriptional regulator [Vreelandella nigrificans]|uniref:LysR family transcriptional regulator n=1 Tax=Vreelandella nigrificans TaxID=2042704 RepID=A0A2A4HM97_9GAMM|nr:LysR family transcriptional regulator [Halomonas nigrificans]PCF95335.1 LysR family transcriptional regulator [Halomonas nigrificans]
MAAPNLNDLYYFVKVVDHGGFSPAGRALGIAKSKLSRRVGELENQLNVRLMHRSTRHLTLTDIGQRYYQHCKAMLVEAEAAQQFIEETKQVPCGTIRISCPTGLLSFHVSAMLADFMVLYPDIQVHLEGTNRRIDPFVEGIDIALRARPLPLEDSELVLKVLSDRGQCLVASPALINQYGMPSEPHALSELPSLSRARPEETHVWHLQRGTEEQKIEHSPRFITTDMTALYRAALAGVGIVQLPSLMLGDALTSKTLISVLPEWQPRREVIHAVYPSRRGLLPSVRALLDFLAERYAAIGIEH